MNKLNAKEILDRLNRLQEIAWLYPQQFVDEGLREVKRNLTRSDNYGFKEPDFTEILQIVDELGEISVVVNTTESKEYEYEIHAINYFKDHDVYIETRGTYASYDGTTFDSGFGREVRAVKKVLTTFEEV